MFGALLHNAAVAVVVVGVYKYPAAPYTPVVIYTGTLIYQLEV